MTPEVHTPITASEIAQTFDQAPHPTDLSVYAPEDWFVFAVFWLMALSVFLQFFTRYALNDSLAWTEEIAIYCLVVTVFVGAVMCTRLTRHIHVDLIYRFLSPKAGRVLATIVDVIKVIFFAYATYLVWQYTSIVSSERMVTIDLPKSIVFYAVLAGFAMMAVRSLIEMIVNLRRGYSVLERPEIADGSIVQES